MGFCVSHHESHPSQNLSRISGSLSRARSRGESEAAEVMMIAWKEPLFGEGQLPTVPLRPTEHTPPRPLGEHSCGACCLQSEQIAFML